jgi:ubiquinone/menaquinone biosynthesis C-methylase UbiE
MHDDSAEVGRYYDDVIFEIELDRLTRLSPIEFAMTTRYLDRYLPPHATVAEIGVGGGQYSELLAARGCRLHLIDVSRKLLNAVHARLPEATAHHASATDLPLEDASCGAVLMLGPLYHLTRVEDRRRAVAEAARVLNPGGVVFAAGINRLAYLRDAFRMWPETVIDRREFHAGYLRDGVLNPEIAPPIGHAHLTTREEFAALFPPAFRQIKLAALESFAAQHQAQIKSFPNDVAEAWLDLVEQTAELPEAFGIAEHFLYIGERVA